VSELRPCTACKRHVRASATTCPFCDVALAPGRAQYVRPRALARAAVFSAALVGCKDHKPPAPKPVPAQGSDDLENLLDQQARTADHPATAPGDAAVQVATPDDAAVAAVVVDAGIDPKVLYDKKRQAEERKKHVQEIQQRRHEAIDNGDVREHINAKPYGAPPARRRVV
jgi:hypothetical protein